MSALTLWTDWLKQGYAPNSVINNTQTTSWQEFATGEYAFAENGTWQLGNAKKAGFEYGIIPVPQPRAAPHRRRPAASSSPCPVQTDTARYATTQKLVACLAATDNSLTTDTTLSYIAPTEAVQAKQVAANPELKVWVDAVKAAKGRTSDNLGTKYPKISQPLWTAVQAALSGSKTPQAALTAAQTAARDQLTWNQPPIMNLPTMRRAVRSVDSPGGAAPTAAPPGVTRRRTTRTTSALAGWAFLAPIVVYLVAFYAYPLYRNLDLSLRHYTVRSFVQGDAPFIGLDNYRKVMADPTFGPALVHTVVFTLVSLAFQFAIGMALAVFFPSTSGSPRRCARCSSCRGCCR